MSVSLPPPPPSLLIDNERAQRGEKRRENTRRDELFNIAIHKTKTKKKTDMLKDEGEMIRRKGTTTKTGTVQYGT
jgi:hypothetical protein